MHVRQFNFWIAFADIVFMLFVTVLVLAARGQVSLSSAQGEMKKLIAQNNNLAAERSALQDQVKNLFGCRGAEALLDQFSACITSEFGSKRGKEPNPCAVTVGEDLIRFPSNSDQPADVRAARAVVGCLFDTTARFARESPVKFEQIQTIHIDGFTDCEGELGQNAVLGARRSLRLYAMLLDEVRSDPALRFDPDKQASLLSKFAVRSFGETRPVPFSRCAERGSFDDDRRVTVSIDMKFQRGGAVSGGKDGGGS
jgi:outer membrane protein OmpA-like peptidoglycan-associated protein